MSSSLQSAGAPGVPRCSEATTGAVRPAALPRPLLQAIDGLESASLHLSSIHELGKCIGDELESLVSRGEDDERLQALLHAHFHTTLAACTDVFNVLKALGQREAK
jgi:hypothetical protein